MEDRESGGVTLKQRTGYHMEKGQRVEDSLAIDDIYYDGRNIAMICHHNGANVCFCVAVPDAVRDHVIEHVTAIRNEQGVTTGKRSTHPMTEEELEAAGAFGGEEDDEDEESTIWTPDDYEEGQSE